MFLPRFGVFTRSLPSHGAVDLPQAASCGICGGTAMTAVGDGCAGGRTRIRHMVADPRRRPERFTAVRDSPFALQLNWSDDGTMSGIDVFSSPHRPWHDHDVVEKAVTAKRL